MLSRLTWKRSSRNKLEREAHSPGVFHFASYRIPIERGPSVQHAVAVAKYCMDLTLTDIAIV